MFTFHLLIRTPQWDSRFENFRNYVRTADCWSAGFNPSLSWWLILELAKILIILFKIITFEGMVPREWMGCSPSLMGGSNCSHETAADHQQSPPSLQKQKQNCSTLRSLCHEISVWSTGLPSFMRKFMVPTRTGKPGKWESVFQSGKIQGILNRQEKSGNLTQNTGNTREFYPKYWKSEEIFASFWLIWHTCQWAYAIMICLSLCHCHVIIIVIIIIVIVVIIVGVICVQLCQWEHWSQKLYILQIYAHISLVYAHEILGQCDVYFWNGSHFSKFLNVALLSTWLSLET